HQAGHDRGHGGLAARLRPALPAHLEPGAGALGAARAGAEARREHAADRRVPRRGPALRQGRPSPGVDRDGYRPGDHRRVRHRGPDRGAGDRHPAPRRPADEGLRAVVPLPGAAARAGVRNDLVHRPLGLRGAGGSRRGMGLPVHPARAPLLRPGGDRPAVVRRGVLPGRAHAARGRPDRLRHRDRGLPAGGPGTVPADAHPRMERRGHRAAAPGDQVASPPGAVSLVPASPAVGWPEPAGADPAGAAGGGGLAGAWPGPAGLESAGLGDAGLGDAGLGGAGLGGAGLEGAWPAAGAAAAAPAELACTVLAPASSLAASDRLRPVAGSKTCSIRTSTHSSASWPSRMLVAGSSRATTVSAVPLMSARPASLASSSSSATFAVCPSSLVKYTNFSAPSDSITSMVAWKVSPLGFTSADMNEASSKFSGRMPTMTSRPVPALSTSCRIRPVSVMSPSPVRSLPSSRVPAMKF